MPINCLAWDTACKPTHNAAGCFNACHLCRSIFVVNSEDVQRPFLASVFVLGRVFFGRFTHRGNSMYFEIYQVISLSTGLLGGGGGGDWRWRLKAANHKIIASGQGYTNKSDCEHAINLMKATTIETPVQLVNA